MKGKGVKKGISRRQFLKGAVAGAGVLGMAELGAKEVKALPIGMVPRKWDYEADVVVIGYGGAGAGASIEAHDAGAKVLMLEKMPKGLEGGNTCASGGGTVDPYDKEKAVAHIVALGKGVSPVELVRPYVDTIAGVHNWIRSQGGKLDEHGIHDYSHFFCTKRAVAGDGSLYPSGLDQYWYVGQGPALFDFLSGLVKKRNIEVLYESPATDLIQNPYTRAVLGVKAARQGKEIYINAKRGVIMALGGYEANLEMYNSFNYPGMRVYTRGTPGNTGDGIYMAQKVGAALWHMGGTEIYERGVAPVPHLPVIMACSYAGKVGSYIVVNKYGKRYNREDRPFGHAKVEPYEFHLDAWGDDPAAKCDYTNYPPYLIFDESFRAKGPVAGGGYLQVKKLYAWSKDNSKEIEKGLIKKADTIRELAYQLRIDPAGLEETIRKYNQYCAAGKDPDFGRPQRFLEPLKTPPYYGVEMYLGFTNTQGGAKRNGQAQIVDKDNNPIPRLYGAGEFGSIYGFLYHGSGNVSEAIMVGRLAGKSAAAEKPWS
jgi:succinate dehydrogenase/fumarate reductase flavoprotein subunit